MDKQKYTDFRNNTIRTLSTGRNLTSRQKVEEFYLYVRDNVDKILMENKDISRDDLAKIDKYNEKRMPFFHATCTGEDFENLFDFLEQGIKIEHEGMRGYSKKQGSGFYVWTDPMAAINHIDSGHVADKGRHMLIEIDSKLTSENFDLDFEGHPSIVKRFFYQNLSFFELFNKSIRFGDEMISIKNTTVSSNAGDTLIHFCDKRGNIVQTYSISDNEASPGSEAMILASVFEEFKDHFPVITKKFEENFFNEIREEKKIGILKYNNHRAIPRIKDIYLKVNRPDGATYKSLEKDIIAELLRHKGNPEKLRSILADIR